MCLLLLNARAFSCCWTTKIYYVGFSTCLFLGFFFSVLCKGHGWHPTWLFKIKLVKEKMTSFYIFCSCINFKTRCVSRNYRFFFSSQEHTVTDTTENWRGILIAFLFLIAHGLIRIWDWLWWYAFHRRLNVVPYGWDCCFVV